VLVWVCIRGLVGPLTTLLEAADIYSCKECGPKSEAQV
jgi:hypothetical protein